MVNGLVGQEGDAAETDSREEEWFRRSLIIGAAAKEIARAILESAGYVVYPFGFESSFSVLKQQMTRDHLSGEAARRIHSMPDLLAASDQELHLVEVKFRRRDYEDGSAGVWLDNQSILRYQRYWPESILLLVSPHGSRFFAQRVNELETEGAKDDESFFPYEQFLAITELLSRTRDVRLWPYYAAVDNLSTFLMRRRRRGKRR